MSPENEDQKALRELRLENQRLLTENNQLLKKMYRASLWSFWIRIIILLVIIGVPVALYYYVVEPYFSAVGSSLENFQDGLQQVPGWEQFRDAVSGNGDTNSVE